MKHKLQTALFATVLILSGCSKPELIDGPDPELLEAPLQINVQDLSNRALAYLYNDKTLDNWKVESASNSEVVFNLNVEKKYPDSRPQSLIIKKINNNSYSITLKTTESGYSLDYDNLIASYLVDDLGRIDYTYDDRDWDEDKKKIDDEGNIGVLINEQYEDWNVDASLIWYVGYHGDYRTVDSDDLFNDLFEAQIIYTKES